MKNAITLVISDFSNSPDRTSTYQKAILDNPTDFAGKVRRVVISWHFEQETEIWKS